MEDAQGSGEEEDGGLPTYRVTTEAATVTEAVTGSEGEDAAASEDKTADSGEAVATTEDGAEAPAAGYDVNTVPTSEEKPVKQGTQKPSPSPTKAPGAKKPAAKNPATAAPTSPVSAAPAAASGPVTDYTLPQENKKPGAPLKAEGKAKAAAPPASTAAPAATAEAPLPKSGSLDPKDATEVAAEEEEEVKEEEEKEEEEKEEEKEKEEEEEKESAAGEGEEGARKCPGGSLAACVKVCPGTSGRLYGACVAGCGDRCPE